MTSVRTLPEIAVGLVKGDISSSLVTQACLDAALDASGEGARVFTSINFEGACQQACEADKQLKSGLRRGLLTGIPISIKDLFDVRGEQTRAGSTFLSDELLAKADAPAVARLRAAGAILVGRTNMTEFAFSGLGINPHYGTPLNPFHRDERRIPGGSSSGAAVSITDGMAFGAIGTDTGGSVRIPAALCGVTGFKPTARRVPLEGVFPLSPSLDSVGVIAPTVACCAMLYSVISGDASWHLSPYPLSRVRFGVLEGYVLENLDHEVGRSFDWAISRLSHAGACVTEFASHAIAKIPELNSAGGFSAAESYRIHQRFIVEHQKEYDPRVLSRIVRGASIVAGNYRELCTSRAHIIAETQARMSSVDALLMPTVPRVAPLIKDVIRDDISYAETNAVMLRNPSLVNFIDGCALSIPCHLPGDAPVGLMVVGSADKDTEVLSIGLSIERALAKRASRN